MWSLRQNVSFIISCVFCTGVLVGGGIVYFFADSPQPSPMGSVVMDSLHESYEIGGRLAVEKEWLESLMANENWKQSHGRLQRIMGETTSRSKVLEKTVALLKLHELVEKGNKR